jgi:hypothetical protein
MVTTSDAEIVEHGGPAQPGMDRTPEALRGGWHALHTIRHPASTTTTDREHRPASCAACPVYRRTELAARTQLFGGVPQVEVLARPEAETNWYIYGSACATAPGHERVVDCLGQGIGTRALPADPLPPVLPRALWLRYAIILSQTEFERLTCALFSDDRE